MSRINVRRGVAVLVLAGVLGAPLASSAEPRATGWLWTFLAKVWAKNGCGVDPDGRCAPGQ